MALRRKIGATSDDDDLLRGLLTRTPAAPRKVRSKVLTGQITIHARGFGFVPGTDGESYYVPASLARFLLTGDRISFTAGMAAGGHEVRAVEGVSRLPGRLLCEVHASGSEVQLVPDEACGLPLVLNGPLPAEVAVGDVISVRYGAYEGGLTSGSLNVTFERSLGSRSRVDFELDYALMRYGFDAPMPVFDLEGLEPDGRQDALLEAWQRSQPVPFVTIDSEHTRDIDDAVHAQPREGGGWRVQVAIADVAWYVSEGSALDRWAAERVTSLYLPGRTMPMLPEGLSCERCSLLPGQVRRAVLMTLELSPQGEVLSSAISRELMESVERLTYRQVASFLAGDPGVRFAGQVEQNLQALADVYQVLSARRQHAGKLDFDEPEPTMVQDEQGRWVLSWERRTEAHKLIEELMLLANRTAADLLVQRYGAGLFRHQPAPKADQWALLQSWARDREHDLPEQPNLRAMADLVAAQPSVEMQMAASLKIRSLMQPARYAVQHQHEGGGHFSLSVAWYTHFTSPIRRYADLLVHRLLLAPPEFTPSREDWDRLAQQVAYCSERSHAARLAERLVWDRLKLQAFLAATTREDSVTARVIRSSSQGLRLVVSGWQCSAWLPAAELRSQGYQWVESYWVSSETAQRVLHEGVALQVSWTLLALDRPAYPELRVRPIKD